MEINSVRLQRYSWKNMSPALYLSSNPPGVRGYLGMGRWVEMRSREGNSLECLWLPHLFFPVQASSGRQNKQREKFKFGNFKYYTRHTFDSLKLDTWREEIKVTGKSLLTSEKLWDLPKMLSKWWWKEAYQHRGFAGQLWEKIKALYEHTPLPPKILFVHWNACKSIYFLNHLLSKHTHTCTNMHAHIHRQTLRYTYMNLKDDLRRINWTCDLMKWCFIIICYKPQQK